MDTKLGVLLWSQATDWDSFEATAKRVDQLGYDSLWTWDHLYAIFGDPYQPIFEGYTTLAAYRSVRGPKRLYLGDFGHAPAENPPAEFDYAAEEVKAWFDHFLKGVPNGIDKRPQVEIGPDPWRRPTKSFRTLPKTRTLSFAFRQRGGR